MVLCGTDTAEIRTGHDQLTQETERLAQKTRHTEILETKADEIVEFYEQIKEMSKSLDLLETFLIFSEALSEYFQFEAVQLALFCGMLELAHTPMAAA